MIRRFELSEAIQKCRVLLREAVDIRIRQVSQALIRRATGYDVAHEQVSVELNDSIQDQLREEDQ